MLIRTILYIHCAMNLKGNKKCDVVAKIRHDARMAKPISSPPDKDWKGRKNRKEKGPLPMIAETAAKHDAYRRLPGSVGYSAGK
jgi:hypothetical protein